MQGFLLSIRVVTPILLMLCVGMLVRWLGWVDEKTLNVMDRLGFKLLLPTQLFYSLYRAEWNVSVYGKPLLASIIVILIILVLALLIFGRLEPDPKRRGPVIQCEIRVNFVIFGMAIIASLYGSENTGLIAIMAAIIIPLTSTISAILFEVYRGGRVKPTMLLLNIIKNPYLIGAALGLIFLLLRIPLPQPVEKTVSDIGGMATPYCLIVLGGSIHLSRFGDYGRSLWLAVLGKKRHHPTCVHSIGGVGWLPRGCPGGIGSYAGLPHGGLRLYFGQPVRRRWRAGGAAYCGHHTLFSRHHVPHHLGSYLHGVDMTKARKTDLSALG